ncbi:MAG: response regulator [Desulfarculus sp.]|jgi:DNA-binding response OmpR family regulator|nr:MAG: response regulator [Desulfarculus sp.]
MKILVVTPAPARVLPFTSSLNKEAGWYVSQTASGAEALALAAADRPGLVVWDERTRDLAGVEFVRRLLLLDAGINVAVLSARAPETVLAEYEGLGLVACLPDQPGTREASALRQKLEHLQAL